MSAWEINGRVVVITGASGGLGSALAERLLAQGAKIGLLDLSAEALEAQALELGAGERVFSVEADVRSMESLEGAMSACAAHFGKIDVVVANAGIGPLGSLSKLDPEVFDRTIDINLNGVWRTFRAALPYVQAQEGYLLAVSSMAAFIHSPLHSAYAASKAGVWAMCDSVRLELRDLNVGVGSVHPTFFPTPMLEAAHQDPAGAAIWGGNKGGLWAQVSKEEVVEEIFKGIVGRKNMIVVPKRLNPVARVPGLVRRFVDRVGFSKKVVRRSIELSNPTGYPLKPDEQQDPIASSDA